MHRRKFMKSGDYLTLVPLGAMLTLCYNVDGILDSVMSDGKILSDNHDVLQAVKKYKTFPMNLHIKNGRTEVRGVLYTSNIPECLGKLPDKITDIYIEDYIRTGRYNFFATTFSTDSVSYSGYNVNAMTEWLRMAGFHTLPGFVVPSEENKIEAAMKRYLVDDTSFIPGLVSYYLISNASNNYDYISAGLHGYIVDYNASYENISEGFYHPNSYPEISENGDFVVNLVLKDNDSEIQKRYGYNLVSKYDLHSGKYVILNDLEEIVFSSAEKHDSSLDVIQCPFCKKLITVDPDKDVMCNNKRCVSRMYPNMKHALSVLHLTSMSYSEYCSNFKSFANVEVSDIFTLPEYHNAIIDVTLQDIFDAIVPIQEVRNRNVFRIFVNNCANNLETLRYYVANPDEILSDISELRNMSSGKELVSWLKNVNNVKVFNNFINSPNIHITLKDKEYAGDPILRGQHVCITGKFKHGDTTKIANILSSYSATTCDTFDDKTSVVVVGDIKEDVSGVMIHSAKMKGVPVVSESQFFSEYDIDTDILNNLQ